MGRFLPLLLLLPLCSPLSHFSYSGGQPSTSSRFVHFTTRLSIRNIKFQPLYGSLQVSALALIACALT